MAGFLKPGQTCVLAILNITPDSFSGDGLVDNVPAAVERGRQAVADGAHVLDVGGESSAYWKPGFRPVGAPEEMRRILPVIEGLKQALPDTPISVDTRKPEVASAALAAGASWVNDIDGVWDQGAMAAVAARHGCPYIVMHNKREAAYPDGVVTEVCRDLAAAAARAESRGVAHDRLLLDPGLGFGKTPEHSLELLRRTAEVAALGFPVVIGPSRKRFLGRILGTPEGDRLEGTAAAVAVAVLGGARVVRVHDIKAIARVVRVVDAIVSGRLPA